MESIYKTQPIIQPTRVHWVIKHFYFLSSTIIKITMKYKQKILCLFRMHNMKWRDNQFQEKVFEASLESNIISFCIWEFHWHLMSSAIKWIINILMSLINTFPLSMKKNFFKSKSCIRILRVIYWIALRLIWNKIYQ